MRIRSLAAILALIALCIALVLPSLAQSQSNAHPAHSGTKSLAPPAQHRVLLDVSTVLYDGWAQAIINAQNLLNTFGPTHVEIEVIVRGPGLAMLMKTDTEFAEKLAALSNQGVRFVACGQTLSASHSTRDDLLPFASVADSGVAEIVRRQEAGWSYIKSGY
jgi:hypothetical protein